VAELQAAASRMARQDRAALRREALGVERPALAPSQLEARQVLLARPRSSRIPVTARSPTMVAAVSRRADCVAQLWRVGCSLPCSHSLRVGAAALRGFAERRGRAHHRYISVANSDRRGLGLCSLCTTERILSFPITFETLTRVRKSGRKWPPSRH
jgi:hypothetical protein